MGSPDYLTLKAELQKPAYTGLTDQQAADLLNAPVATAATAIAGDKARKLVLPAAMVLPAASAQVQARWQPLLAILQGVASVDVDAEFAGIYTALVADLGPLCGQGGVPALDQARYTRLTAGPPTSPALQLAGWGIPVTANDVAAARAK